MKDKNHWRVEVVLNGNQLVAIEPEMLSGNSDLSEDELEVIRLCADHLRGFAGNGAEISDFPAPEYIERDGDGCGECRLQVGERCYICGIKQTG